MQENLEARVMDIIAEHAALLNDFRSRAAPVILQAAQAVIDCVQGGGCVYCCGNGGSAADAQHVAGELVGRFRMNRRALPAVALTTDASILTAVANDFGYDDVFVRQVEALVKTGDLLWAFSTSGTSANVLKAVQLARQRKAFVLSFTGRPDTPLERDSDLCLCAADPSTARSQEIHQLAYHIICELAEQGCCAQDG